MAIPATPSNFWVQQGNMQVFLSWDITATATSYQVQRSTDGIAYSVIASPTVAQYLDTSALVNTTYYYKIAATNGSGTSSYTSAQTVVATLPGKLSLGELRQRAKQAADKEGSNFVTLPEWNFNINQSYYELYDLLITLYEDYYVAPRLSIQTDGTTQSYALPNGQNNSGAPALYKLYGVDLGLDGSTNAWATLKKFDFISRNSFVYPQITANQLGVLNLRYRLMGDKIMFIPIPGSGQYVGLWYFPRLTTLLQDSDVMDGISGWDEYVIVDAAIKALRKEESDVSVLAAQKMALIQRIESSAMNRDAGQPDTISDTRMRSEGYDGGWSDGSYGGF